MVPQSLTFNTQENGLKPQNCGRVGWMFFFVKVKWSYFWFYCSDKQPFLIFVLASSPMGIGAEDDEEEPEPPEPFEYIDED